MKKLSILTIFILLAIFATGCGVATPPIIPTPIEAEFLKSPYIITGDAHVGGIMDFYDEMESLYGPIGLLGGSLIEKVGKYIESIKKCDSILIIPPTNEGIQEFGDLTEKYIVLCPLSCNDLESKLNSNSYPLFYFSRDAETNKIRGIIVIEKLSLGLAEKLFEGVPLNVFFQYQNEELEILG
jgi:hypothetical protein